MSNTQLAVPEMATELFKEKALISQFNAGRHDKGVRWAAEREYALQIIRGSAQLMASTEESLRTSMLQVAWSGLSLAPMLAHGYLLPYRDKDRGIKNCTFSPGYRGLIHLGFKGGMVKSVQAVRVMPQDRFKVETRNNRRIITHEEGAGDRNKWARAVYVITKFMNGGEHIQVTYDTTIEAAKEAAFKRGDKGGMVWRGKFFTEMELKVGIRQAWKNWPMDDGGHLAHAMAVAHKMDDEGDFSDTTKPEMSDQEILVDDIHIREMHAYLTGSELTSEQAEKWLRLLAEAMGLKKIEDLPARLFEEAFTRLKDRMRRSKEKT